MKTYLLVKPQRLKKKPPPCITTRHMDCLSGNQSTCQQTSELKSLRIKTLQSKTAHTGAHSLAQEKIMVQTNLFPTLSLMHMHMHTYISIIKIPSPILQNTIPAPCFVSSYRFSPIAPVQFPFVSVCFSSSLNETD